MDLFNQNFKNVRTRIAPSPTGFLHLGTARTALFNFLFAKNNNGIFILRIEDTDKIRSKKEFEDDIINALKWLGLNWDEEIIRQSKRENLYKKYIEKLIKDKKAYYCFCKEEELENIKSEKLSRGVPPVYNGKCRDLSQKEIIRKLDTEKSVIRLKTIPKVIEFNDLIRGKIKYESFLFGDFIIAKNIKEPLYNLAVVIDDFESRINYVIRGEDHLPNTPKQILLQEALLFPQPNYCHLPLILGTDKSKLSKRHGALAISDYRREGFLKEAIINYLGLLGWNPKTNKEIFPLDELIKSFSLSGIQKSAAIFNIKKLEWFNNYYLKHSTSEELADKFPEYRIKNLETTIKIIDLEKERIKKFSELFEITKFFISLPEYQKELLSWREMDNKILIRNLKAIRSELEKIEINDFKVLKLKPSIEKLTKEFGSGEIYWPLRVALSGQKNSPPPLEIAEILGKEETLLRITKAIDKLAIES